MPRSRTVRKPKIQPDPVYDSMLVTRFIHKTMRQGKKSLAQKIVYTSLAQAAEKIKTEPLELLEKALTQVRPGQEVRPRRVGGATYQVPRPVSKERGEALAMRWILEAARSRQGQPMVQKLTQELVNAYQGGGEAIKKKENTHRMAEANRAFAHFKW